MDFYFVMCKKYMSTTVCANGTVQFTFFLIMRLNIVTSCDSLVANTCNLILSSLKLENKLKKHVRNVAETKYGFAKLFAILFSLRKRCDYVITSRIEQWSILLFCSLEVL